MTATQGAAVAAPTDLDELAVATLPFLAADAVQASDSGHPGLPLGAAPAAWMLWPRHLRHDLVHPQWPDRDRFVLSAGHGLMLLDGLLHVFGYDLPLDELRRFRQPGSRTPGHPEVGHTPGVETTTGPLGQGLANAVGMALAERMLAGRCNTGEQQVVGHRTWVLAGNGDLMEDISHEAASLAGRLRLGRLTVIYDDNDITIDGPASRGCGDDAAARFGWRPLWVDDGNDLVALDRAFTEAAQIEDRPTLIVVRTTIGYGAGDVEATPAATGSPLGDAAIAAMRRRFGVARHHLPRTGGGPAGDGRGGRRAGAGAGGVGTHARRVGGDQPRARRGVLARPGARASEQDVLVPLAEPGARMATRKASVAALTALAAVYPALVGGSADLAASTNTTIPGGDVGPGDFTGRTVHFGIREHAMAAAMDGIALHGGLRPVGSTFLVFADYLRPAMRLAALMRQPVIHVFTHDSVHVGEDGPTHQPIEQLESLRLIPGLTPCCEPPTPPRPRWRGSWPRQTWTVRQRSC